jgi:hypothetical protein
MKLSDSEKLLAGELLESVDAILLHLSSDYEKEDSSYPDLIKARNILRGGDVAAMKTIRNKFRNAFRMIDESVRVDDELNSKMNDAYEVVVANTVFN